MKPHYVSQETNWTAEGTPKNLFEDIYVKGSEPKYVRGRILEENYSYELGNLELDLQYRY